MSAQPPQTIDLSKYIESRFFGERPHIRGRRIPVAIIVYQKRANQWMLDETVWNFSLTEAEVLAALLHYEEHRAELDAQEAEEQHLIDEMKRQYGEN